MLQQLRCRSTTLFTTNDTRHGGLRRRGQDVRWTRAGELCGGVALFDVDGVVGRRGGAEEYAEGDVVYEGDVCVDVLREVFPRRGRAEVVRREEGLLRGQVIVDEADGVLEGCYGADGEDGGRGFGREAGERGELEDGAGVAGGDGVGVPVFGGREGGEGLCEGRGFLGVAGLGGAVA